jgi:hypothetical protein
MLGAVVGKALESLREENAVIQLLVTLEETSTQARSQGHCFRPVGYRLFRDRRA